MELIIDIGSSKVSILNKKYPNIIHTEPAIAMCEYGRKNKLKPIALGAEVYDRLSNDGYLSRNIIYPIIKEGNISNSEAAKLLLEYSINKVIGRNVNKSKIKLLVLVSSGLTAVERARIEGILVKLGYRDIYIIESSIAVSRLIPNISSFIIDIGADKTELAVISNRKIIAACSIGIGGNLFDTSIIDYVSKKYNVTLKKHSANKVMIALSSMDNTDSSVVPMTVKSAISQEPQSIEITTSDIREAIIKHIDNLIESIVYIYNIISEELQESLYHTGLHLCGGSSKIKGVREYISSCMKIDIIPLNEPLHCQVIGGSLLFDNKLELKNILKIDEI